ncbi:MAG: helix-turn-helix domain-containing protein [Candidatus Thorarchaeota archaeon]
MPVELLSDVRCSQARDLFRREETKKRKTQRKMRKKINPDKVRRMYFDGKLTQAQIAKRLGVSPTTIRRLFEDNGWEARRPRYTDEDIRRLYFHNRLSKSEIARILGIANSTVHRAFERNQWPTLPPPTKANPEEARKLYEQGLTHKEIAGKLGVARTTIGSYLRGLGIQKRKFNSDAERQQERKEQARRQRKKVQDLRDKLFGRECKVCGVDRSTRKLAIHKKDFSEHELNALWKLSFLRKVNPEEWSALCTMCHRGVHWTNDDLGMNWSSIRNRIKRRLSEESEKSSKRDSEYALDSEKESNDLKGEVEDIRKALFGDECSFCGPLEEEKALVVHRKDGQSHQKHTLWSKDHLQRMDPDEWQALCQKHHRYVHWGMKYLGLKWEDLESAFTDANASG